MQLQLAVFCDAAADYGGKLNLLGTFDTILTSHLPAIHPQCALAVRLTFQKHEEGRHVLKLAIVDEDGRPVVTPSLELQMDVNVPEDSIFLSRNAIVNMQNLTFEKAGLYSVEISVSGIRLGNIPLLIKQVNPKSHTQPQGPS
ncbi:MAG: hypothetical protein FJ405_15820 [Verrucomicrobia bacterium]|nr:hypothetical protein [Verrucomicrobiota bacterium]